MNQWGRGARSEPDDAAVIESSWRDPEGFAALFDRHAPHIHRYLSRRVGMQAAEDLVAETFLAAFGKRRRYDLRYGDARPWLYGIATNLVGQHRRDEVRQYRARQAAGPAPDVAGHDERVAADVTAGAIRQVLAAALAGLPDRDRDVLLLIAWEDLTYEEAARAAALFKLLATTHGITVKRDVTDVAGRPGVAVSWNFEGSSAMLVFSARTYTYLGWTTRGELGQVGGDALLKAAIVDRVCQAP